MGPDSAFERQNYFLLLLEASFFEWRASSFFDVHWKLSNRGFDAQTFCVKRQRLAQLT